MKKVLFVRQFHALTGGHLKHADYISHTQADPRFAPVLHVTEDSDKTALEALLPPNLSRTSLPCETDILFLAGMDWAIADKAGQSTKTTPVINFIQGMRHADPAVPLYSFLSRPALRICVSPEVTEALVASGQVHGPIVTIENGIDLDQLSSLSKQSRNGRVLVIGLKDKALAQGISDHLERLHIPHDILVAKMPRAAYLALVSHYDVVVCIPLKEEGFYLPPLEAMAMQVSVVVPDCIGNRSFCRDGETCLVPKREARALAEAAANLLSDPRKGTHMRAQALRKSQQHGLAQERHKYHAALSQHLHAL
ncbi:glycosyltransferase [uncultured Tateyamaria sp.]|uniref:glycosyltransferase n=1 Tax=uncultured Tateyamaria sp. TaxID=455651 RepID=UPI00262C2854|nr:glycosyltransferase [uncultured Tateyamaria sp.]